MNLSRALASRIKAIPIVRSLCTQPRPETGENFSAKISSEEHNSITLYEGGIAIPPIRLRDMVARKLAILPEDFILLGRSLHEDILRLAADGGMLPDKTARILEFGVGCGRVARHFLCAGYRNFTGTDVDVELIDWCNHNLTSGVNARFLRNEYLPPLPLETGGYDFAFTISVFTHMSVAAQHQWAEEMARVVRPGGGLVLSFLEKASADLPAGVSVVERHDAEFRRSWLGVGKAPKVYCNTFNTLDYIQRLFFKSFDLVLARPFVIRKVQSLALFVRRASP